MATVIPNMMLGNQGAVDKGMQAMGLPPIGNAGGSNLPGPTSIAQPAGSYTAPTGAVPIMQQPAGTQVNNGVTSTVPGVSGGNLLTPGGAVPNQFSTQQQQQSDKQLTDTFGKGIGGDINSVINNLGSNDSTYMQAYSNAMAGQNAENLSTLNTTLGNAGVGANSSTAAIANADFESNVTSQEGLQEQQLQQLDEENLIGLLQGTQGAANKEASTSVWGDIGGVLGSIGSDIGSALPDLL